MRPSAPRTDVGAALDARDLEFFHELSHSAASASAPATHGHMPEQDWGSFASTLALPPHPDDVLKAEADDDAPPDALTPPNKRAKWTRRLVITKQPASEFYKDEGGKANALEVEVSLIEFNEFGESARSPDDEFIDIPLRILLFFEDGKRVDDSDQEIFRFVGNEYDSVVIRAATRKAAVQFRLEKVSRRKDGKRFRLRIEVDQEQCTANVADLSPIFTNAICVLSKRKHHAQAADTANRAREPPLKLLKRDLGRMEEKLDERVGALMEEMGRMSRQIQLQSELLGKIFMPSNPAVTGPLLTPDNSTMEWFLKSGLMDDVLVKTPGSIPHHGTSTALPYFSVSDESEEREDVHSSPASSDADVPPRPHSSVLTFAEF